MCGGNNSCDFTVSFYFNKMINAPFRSPHKIHSTFNEYGNTSFNSWYHANGINIPFHNGIDINFGTPRDTFGTECICPFDSAVVKVTWNDTHSTKGNGVTIQSEPIDGVIYQIVFWHTCELNVKEGDKLKKGDVVCYIGNSGLCSPARSILRPFDGSHCHLMLFKFKQGVNNNWELQNSNNGVGGAVNPRELFDFTQCSVGADTGFERDMWGISDMVSWMGGDILVKYFKYLNL